MAQSILLFKAGGKGQDEVVKDVAKHHEKVDQETAVMMKSKYTFITFGASEYTFITLAVSKYTFITNLGPSKDESKQCKGRT